MYLEFFCTMTSEIPSNLQGSDGGYYYLRPFLEVLADKSLALLVSCLS